MPYGFVQQRDNSSATAVSTLATSSTISYTTGNKAVVVVNAGGVVAPTVGDGGTNNYQLIGHSAVDNAGLYDYFYYADSVSGSSLSPTASGISTITAILVQEYSGLASGAPILLNSTAYNGPNVTGANVLTSGNGSITGAQVPAMIWGFEHYLQNQEVPTAGTSPLLFTGETAVWVNFSGTGAGAFCRSEDCRVTTSGSYGSSFGLAGNGKFGVFSVTAIAFPEVSSAAMYTPFTQTQWFVNDVVIQQ